MNDSNGKETVAKIIPPKHNARENFPYSLFICKPHFSFSQQEWAADTAA
ncbi:hypothetical protein NT6N_01730 [Oceaniferula spumae]|uniref:Uncharacterized protein n=1 Tax=Oceaniferula spumae TaxID=2979115 RepID=A0AAT9FGP3_9BACT